MSGMFQRIARRQTDRSDEPVASQTAGEPERTAPTAGAEPEQPTTEHPPVQSDAPTERIDVVAPPAAQGAPPDPERQTALQPAVAPPDGPPPKIDLRSRIAGVEASAAPPPSAPPAPSAPTPVAAQAPATSVEQQPAGAQTAPQRPGFRARGRMRRRLRYLRRLRELQVRDLGGLVFDLRRFERKRDDLVLQKLDQIRACDDELRALERALGERRDLRDVREPGIGGTCPRCFAIFGSTDRFCASCGAALGGRVQGPAQTAEVPLAPPAGETGP